MPGKAKNDDTHRVEVDSGTRKEIFHIDKRYTDLKSVSEGSYGFVAAAHDTLKDRGVAIKKVTNFLRDLDDAKRIAREIKLLMHLSSHQGVIRVLDVMTSPPNTTDFSDVYIVCPLMESDLERIISSDQPLSEAHAQYFMYQILRALKYIHSAGIIHRDLKPGNLLVNANCDLTICDFGLARGAGAEELTEYVVTRWYRAPELLLSCSSYTTAIDIWSVGCICAELIGRKPLFPGNNYIHQLELITAVLGSPRVEDLDFVTAHGARDAIRSLGHKSPSDLKLLLGSPNPMAIDLISKMLSFNPRKRISVEEALEHPWLAGYRDVDSESVSPVPFECDLDARDSTDLGRNGLQSSIFNDMINLRAAMKMQDAFDGDEGEASGEDVDMNDKGSARKSSVDHRGAEDGEEDEEDGQGRDTGRLSQRNTEHASGTRYSAANSEGEQDVPSRRGSRSASTTVTNEQLLRYIKELSGQMDSIADELAVRMSKMEDSLEGLSNVMRDEFEEIHIKLDERNRERRRPPPPPSS